MGGGAFQWILKQAANLLAAPVVRQLCDIPAVQRNRAAVRQKGSRDGVEQGGFARAVGAEDGDEIARVQMERQILQRLFLIDRAGVKGQTDVVQLQHLDFPPFLARMAGNAMATATITAETSFRHSLGRSSRRAMAMMNR